MAPVPPPTAFDDFFRNHVLPQRDHYRYRDQEDALRIAREAWGNFEPESRALRAQFEEVFEMNMGKYDHDMREFTVMNDRMALGFQPGRTARDYQGRRRMSIRGGGENEDEAEAKSELPLPPPSREGGGGGFTSIN